MFFDETNEPNLKQAIEKIQEHLCSSFHWEKHLLLDLYMLSMSPVIVLNRDQTLHDPYQGGKGAKYCKICVLIIKDDVQIMFLFSCFSYCIMRTNLRGVERQNRHKVVFDLRNHTFLGILTFLGM